MIETLLRPHFKTFEPYRTARSEMASGHILLDANELATDNPSTFDEVALNRYPDPSQELLRGEIGNMCGVVAEKIFISVGSDEVIDLLVRLCCEPGKDSVAVLGPTYGVYSVAAKVNDVGVIDIDLDKDFQIDIEKTLKEVTPQTKILFCCSPNNPTGNLLGYDAIVALCEKLRCLVVLDLAYIEFADEDEANRLVELSQRFSNLVLLRTLSKAWGMAGIRFGYCIAQPDVVSYLLRIKSPYNINTVTSRLAMVALHNEDHMKQSVSVVIRERTRLAKELVKKSVVINVYPSEANFLLVRFQNSESVYQKLLAYGIVVRRRSENRLRDCLRITIGTPKENTFLLECLDTV